MHTVRMTLLAPDPDPSEPPSIALDVESDPSPPPATGTTASVGTKRRRPARGPPVRLLSPATYALPTAANRAAALAALPPPLGGPWFVPPGYAYDRDTTTWYPNTAPGCYLGEDLIPLPEIVPSMSRGPLRRVCAPDPVGVLVPRFCAKAKVAGIHTFHFD